MASSLSESEGAVAVGVGAVSGGASMVF